MADQLERQLERLVWRAEIEEVLARYCIGVDRADEAVLASCYHPDATDDHGTFNGLAVEFAHWAVAGASKVWQASHHTVHNVVIDWLDGGDTATVDSYVLAFNLRSVGDLVEVFAGRYADRFERRDGAWLIAHRQAWRDVDTLVDRRRWAGKIPRSPER